MSQDPTTDAVPEAAADAADDATVPAGGQEVRTGVDRVDAVLEAVGRLEERPIEEHVGVFEAAHEELRRALDVHRDDAR